MSRSTTALLDPSQGRHAPLLQQYAFVLQLRAGVNIQQRYLTGRVEHVQSGQTIPFDSLEDLLAFMAQVLATLPAPEA